MCCFAINQVMCTDSAFFEVVRWLDGFGASFKLIFSLDSNLISEEHAVRFAFSALRLVCNEEKHF
jgi:hypothetical protein